jgi:transketolase|tara:strand:+ start:4577 stop:7141 length:2565 start_codon:yes stop_codon:yes gene_type:complete
MTISVSAGQTVVLHSVTAESKREARSVALPDYDRERFDDVAFLTAMNLCLMGNYAQTGHFGGPLAYTPYNVACHLAGPELGGLRYDLREPKFPYADKFMLAGGHCIPTCYSLWMILYEALRRQHLATGNDHFFCDPNVAILPIDALGFRRGAGALESLLQSNGLTDHELFADAKGRGIRSLSGHAESIDVTNDVNGGPSGIGVATAAGKAVFWDYVGASSDLKVMALEGEFALTEGHAQELKNIALSQQVGKRLRVLLSENNAGIDDTLVGGVIKSKYTGYDIAQQWVSWGWNVFTVDDGNDFDQVIAAFKAMEEWPEDDRRPMLLVGPTTKGWWPAVRDGKVSGQDQLISYPSHPYAFKMNGDYFVALAETFERKYGVTFEGIRDGVPASDAERLVQFKTNVDIVMSVMEQREGLGAWIADRVINIAESVDRSPKLRIDPTTNPFMDDRLKVQNLPESKQDVVVENPHTGDQVERRISLFLEPGLKKGPRRAVSEIGAWLNYVTNGRFMTMAADLSGSINIENANLLGHYDPVDNPYGTRLKAAIQEAGNASTMIGLVSQNASVDPKQYAGVWGISGTYGAFTPLMYTPARVFSQMNQDSPFELGVLHILAGHSGPETAADARTHFGIFAPQTWTLLPRGQVINLYFWDYNDVAAGYFAAVQKALEIKEIGIIVIHVARPDFNVADRTTFADTDVKAAAKGLYLIRDYDSQSAPMGTVFVQGSSSTMNLVQAMPRLEEAGVNVRIVSVISTELFGFQSKAYQDQILPDESRYDCMVVSTMTKRVPPIPNLGPLTEEYSMYADFDDRWRSGGLEPDVIKESRLDEDSIVEGIVRFAKARDERLERQRSAMSLLV